jgi:MFS family permease
MFAAGITVFTAASVACGFAPGPGWLIGFRAVQGLDAAMLMPIAVVVLAAASCFAIKNKPGQDRPAAGEQAGQMAGTISSPGSSGSMGNNPGSSSGTAS